MCSLSKVCAEWRHSVVLRLAGRPSSSSEGARICRAAVFLAGGAGGGGAGLDGMENIWLRERCFQNREIISSYRLLR